MNALRQELFDEFSWTWNVGVIEDPDSLLVFSEKSGNKFKMAAIFHTNYKYLVIVNALILEPFDAFKETQNVCGTEDWWSNEIFRIIVMSNSRWWPVFIHTSNWYLATMNA